MKIPNSQFWSRLTRNQIFKIYFLFIYWHGHFLGFFLSWPIQITRHLLNYSPSDDKTRLQKHPPSKKMHRKKEKKHSRNWDETKQFLNTLIKNLDIYKKNFCFLVFYSCHSLIQPDSAQLFIVTNSKANIVNKAPDTFFWPGKILFHCRNP